MEKIRIVYEKSTGDYIHIETDGTRTTITNLPIQVSMKAVTARVRAMGLRVSKKE